VRKKLQFSRCHYFGVELFQRTRCRVARVGIGLLAGLFLRLVDAGKLGPGDINFPAHFEDRAWRFSLFGDELEDITEFDPLTGERKVKLQEVIVYANSHYVTPGPTLKQAMEAIRFELAERLKELQAEGRLLEAQRLEQRNKGGRVACRSENVF